MSCNSYLIVGQSDWSSEWICMNCENTAG